MYKGRRVLSFLLIGALTFGYAIPAHADEITEKQEEGEQLEQQMEMAESEKAELAKQLDGVMSSMQKTQEDLTAKQDEIVKTADELDLARVQENDQYESMKKRIKYMYENGNTEFIEILCRASSISDLLNKAEYITKISEYDRQMLREFQTLVKQVEEKEANLKKEEEELKVLQDSLIEQQSQVETLLASKKVEIANLEAAIGENAAEVQKLVEAAKEAARRKKEAEEAARRGTFTQGGNVISGSGQFNHPCPAGHFTSAFGWRSKPFGGGSELHAGIDWGTSGATPPVYAAESGTVTTVAYNSARGNYIIINHGNGLQTLYQHLSVSGVSVGQSVNRGDHIANVGSTGLSTGAHLHFEVHVNGTPVDPASYL